MCCQFVNMGSQASNANPKLGLIVSNSTNINFLWSIFGQSKLAATNVALVKLDVWST